MQINSETQVRLNRFKPRPYQQAVLDALGNKGYKRALCVWCRRAGKDIVAFNYIVRDAIKNIGVYYYILPTYGMARRIIWSSLTNSGARFIDFIPPELIFNINQTEMKITLINGSLIQLLGSDHYDSLVGTNPRGIVFSEYALQDPRAYQYLRPALTANDGWALFISTPRARNHMYELYQIGLNNPNDWFVQILGVDETRHISIQEIEREVSSGEISRDHALQEYYCSFTSGQAGAYYGTYINEMRLSGKIGMVPYESAYKVCTAWDIGNDSTSIIFYQHVGQIVRIIDAYENSNLGLEHYVKVVSNKPYIYHKHIGPHDLRVKEWASGRGMTRETKARQLGISFIIATNLSIEDGIESVRSAFSKIWIDEKNCAGLIKALDSYRKEYDEKRQVYKEVPLHNWASHYADAMRYMCISLPKTGSSRNPEELDRLYRETKLGQPSLPDMFSDDYRVF